MKILQVCAVDFTVKNFLLPLIDFLKQQGNEVDIACSKGDYTSELKKHGYNIIPYPISRSTNVLSHICSLYHLCKIIKKGKYDVVHTHTPIAALLGRIAARLCSVPIIFYTAHGFYFHDDMHPLTKYFHIFLEKVGAFFCNFIFVQSEEDRLTAVKEGIIREPNILTIGNGVDLDRFDPSHFSQEQKEQIKKELKISSKEKIVSIIGRLVREKGYFEFFTAAKLILDELPDTKFIVIGDALSSDYDASKDEISHLIEALGIRKNIIFIGFRSDVERFLSITDVFTLPSYREGMPRSIIEAMAMGVPVVAANIRGSREEVLDGTTGFLVPVKDVKTLAQKILLFLRDSRLAQHIGNAGRERAVNYFSEKGVLQKQWEIYERFKIMKLSKS